VELAPGPALYGIGFRGLSSFLVKRSIAGSVMASVPNIKFSIPDESGQEFFDTLMPTESEPNPIVKKVSPEIAEKETELSKSLPKRRLRNFMEVYESTEKLNFLIPDVLPDHGIVFFGGISATGKTILAIQVLVNLIMNRPTMTWFPEENLPPLTGLFLSLEMSGPEVQLRIKHMYPQLTDEEIKILQERLIIYSEPEGLRLWEDDHGADLVKMIARSKANVVLIDSASVSLGEDLTNQAQVNKSLEALESIRVRMKVCFIVVAHVRKPPNGESTNVENVSINDLFGGVAVANHASAIFLLYEDEKSRREAIRNGNGHEVEKLVHIVNSKTRFGAANAAFKAKLPSLEMTKKGSPLQFRRDVHVLAPLTTSQKKQISARSDGTTIAPELKGLDFSEFLGDEDEI